MIDKNLIKLFPFTKPYKSHIVWNVFYNIFYALFSTISLLTLLAMLEVLFGQTKVIKEEPVYTGIGDIMAYGKDMLYFKISELTGDSGPQYALMLVVAMVIFTFLLVEYST
mgnify:FL=1